MKKWWLALFAVLFPVIAFADSTTNALSFAPPVGDYSVTFLGNLFGMVDGVLQGTGSQIMGKMFGVFNAAVLALGGIIIVYTLMVSTMNTAHEGEFLGKQWSSIWIPVRSTFGLALLIPKASGYCLMQIFVMWVVLQGVGAADKIWVTALSYLNSGGKVVQAQKAIIPPKSGNDKSANLSQGAAKVLTAQVCMEGLEAQLRRQREDLLNLAKEKKLGGCASPTTKNWKDFCTMAVPDFIGSVNVLDIQKNAGKTGDVYSVKMPNFSSQNNAYAGLDGICGTLTWNRFNGLDSLPKGILTENDLKNAQMQRVVAVQQMYMDLSSVARSIIRNNPNVGPPRVIKINDDFSKFAKSQFGVPYTKTGVVCDLQQNPNVECTSWGPYAGVESTPLFNGTQFLLATINYQNIMAPNINLIKQSKSSESAIKAREFIKDATAQGWIMAGSYFYDLVKLTGDVVVTEAGDQDSGLEKSQVISGSDLSAPQGRGGAKALLCQWLGCLDNQSSELLVAVAGSMDGGSVGKNDARLYSSTAAGFAENSQKITLIAQPGLTLENFSIVPDLKLSTDKLTSLDTKPFPCDAFLCIDWFIGNVIYNLMFVPVYNFFLESIGKVIVEVVNAFLVVPLNSMVSIFSQGVAIAATPGANPVLALASMGTHYINTASNLYITLIMLSITTILTPFGWFIVPLIMLGMPLVIAWLTVMLGVGMITAFYIPMLPFIIFIFGGIAWFIAVIEAMVAAPIVALGVTHPEGHDAFGKGEQAVMILMNVFLRPSMMIIGFISAIALTYVGVWLLNSGFEHAALIIQGGVKASGPGGFLTTLGAENSGLLNSEGMLIAPEYKSWAGLYSYFFLIVIYTSVYLTIVQKSFTLIHHLPDKVLRWIGGQPESLGAETAGWAEESKKSVEGAGDKTSGAQAKISEKLSGAVGKGVSKIKDAAVQSVSSGSVSATPGSRGDEESTPKPPGSDEDK